MTKPRESTAIGMSLVEPRSAHSTGAYTWNLKGLPSHDPQNPVWSNFLAVAQLFAGDAEGALLTATRALGTRPDWRPIVETVACCYAATGKWEDARRCVLQMSELQRLHYGVLAPLWEKNPHWRDRVDELLRKAGAGEQGPPISKR